MRNWMALAILLACFAPAGCGDDELGPPEDDLVGTWNATAIEFVGKAGQGAADALATGWSARLTLAADNTGELSVTRSDATSWTWPGSWEVDADLFRIAGQGADISLNDGNLRLAGFDSAYDFDDDGTEEPSKLNLVLRR